MTTTDPITQLLTTQLDDLQPRLEIAAHNVTDLEEQLDNARSTLAYLTAQRTAYAEELAKRQPEDEES